MSMALFIICLVSGGLSFISFLFNRRRPTEMRRRIIYIISVTLLFTAIISGGLSYWASVEATEELQLTRAQVDSTQEQITEIRTPRRMEPRTKRILVTKLKPYAGQKYDMQVFRDQDSLELADVIEAILEEAGWVYTNVYPKQHAKRHAETRDQGVFIVSGRVETTRTTEVRKALHDALTEAGLYNDSSAFIPLHCSGGSGGLPQVGDKISPIPCSESSGRITGIDFRFVDPVIPEDTLVLHLGEERL